MVLTAGERILAEHVRAILGPRAARKQTVAATDPGDVVPLKEFKRRTEKEYIESVLALANGSVTKAAQLLQIDRTYLHQKLVSHSIRQ